MAVSFDAKFSGTTPNFDTLFSGAASPVNSTSMTIGASANALLVGFVWNNTLDANPTSVQWDATGTPQGMTNIGVQQTSDATGNVSLWGLLNPTTGNKTLRVSWGAGNFSGYLSATSWIGVDTSSFANAFKNFTSAQTTGTTQSITVTNASTDVAIHLGADFSTGTPSGGTNTLWFTDATGVPNAWAQYAVGSVNPTMSFTLSASNNGVNVGVSIAAPAADTLGGAMPILMMSRRRRDPVKTLLLPSKYRRRTRGFALAA